MKSYLYIIALSTFCFLSTTCSDEEMLRPTEIESMSRFEFPEGEGEADQIFTEIYDKFGIQVIYKNWKEKDWAKSWLNPGAGIGISKTGSHFTNGEIDSLTIAARFMRDDIFAHFGKKLLMKHKPYIYLVNAYAEIQDFGVFSLKTYVLFSADGLDYKIYSPYAPDTPGYSNNGFPGLFDSGNEVERHNIRSKILYRGIILPAIDKNELAPPSGFTAILDGTTPLELNDRDDKDYYLTRGFIDVLDGNIENPKAPNTDPVKSFGENLSNLFNMYIRLAIYYDEATIQEKYGEYPLVISLYHQTTDYMSEIYEVDLKGIAEKK